MKKITIDDNWFIEDDGENYMIYKDTGKKDKNGAPLYDLVKYPSSIENALAIYARETVADADETITLNEYVQMLADSFANVKKLMVFKTSK